MYNPLHPPPVPPSFGKDKVVPEQQASWPSRLVFSWLGPFLSAGFSRPLQRDDLWELPKAQHTDSLTEDIERNFYVRCPPDQRPTFFRDGPKSTSPADGSDAPKKNEEKAAEKGGVATEETADDGGDAGKKDTKTAAKSKYDSSLGKAIYQTFFWRWWLAGFFKLAADTLRTTTPLLNKVILTWLTNSYVFYHAGSAAAAAAGITQPQDIGYGIGLAFALFAMQEAASLFTNHHMMMMMTTGLSIRSGIIGAIFRKSLRLSGRARLDHDTGKITTMISTDATRLEECAPYIHDVWIAPIQLILGIGLLIGNLGYSALVGLGVLILGFPIQGVLVVGMVNARKKGVLLTDQRVSILNEVLQGIRLVKFYAWEEPFGRRVYNVREQELKAVRELALSRASLTAAVTIIPIAATVLSFITYSLTGHDLNVAVIFTSLQYFQIIQVPMVFFPLAVAKVSDAAVALGRIGPFLTAEELPNHYEIDVARQDAISVNGDFQWETAHQAKDSQTKQQAEKHSGKKDKKGTKTESILPVAATSTTEPEGAAEVKEEDKPFELKDLKLHIKKGSFVAIVGTVGSGKSSLLQALVGEMRKTKGNCIFSGPLAYVPQAAWIMNATLRENILFGQPADEARLREIIKACSLEHDLEMLPHGEHTEIGEKGINLSGGQKARVSLARAAYSGAPIILMDDSLSAVDAYVGRSILDNCLLSGPLADRTRVLVTHSLHVLDKVDYIYVMDKGAIVEQGTYQDLMQDSVIFSRVMEEYGTQEDKEENVEDTKEAEQVAKEAKEGSGTRDELMQEEERLTGSVDGSVYAKYLRAAGGLFYFPLILLLLVGYQGAAVATTVFLGLWTSNSIEGFRNGDYIAVYASTGVAGALFAWGSSFAISIATLRAGLVLFKASLDAVLHSAISFFDTTPMGRVISRLSKDQDTLDTEISTTAFQVLAIASSVVGTAGLVFYTFPLLGTLFAPMALFYYVSAMYYRRSSVEVKRLDSILRSGLYASYSETLTGLSTVRAYRSQERFVRKADNGLDLENRAYYMTVAIQRWLSIRLDFLGNVLILGIGLFAAGFRKSVDPSKIGVVLSYALGITQLLSELVSGYAQNEQNFNAVERVLHYSELPSEGARTTPNDPPASWPEEGGIQFQDVDLVYRDGLPLVLQGVSFEVKPGEKVGIVGRTGAGKSSLLQALFRIVNVCKGSITIDQFDIGKIGLDMLRSRLALVPQDSVLFKGTLRENLDPLGTHTDAELISALKRAWLIPREGPADPTAEAKFGLDANVSDEGSNYSAGEKQLLSLCRALVKNSKIIVLDEATSSVDVETDAKLQRTIQTEFASSTLLCIAHRLNTIVYYDRILVMDSGRVAEYDTPLNLFDKEDSIFRSLCSEAGLARHDIERIRAGVQQPTAA